MKHLARMLAAWNVLAARNVKSTGSAGLGTVKVTTTGLIVPAGKRDYVLKARKCNAPR